MRLAFANPLTLRCDLSLDYFAFEFRDRMHHVVHARRSVGNRGHHAVLLSVGCLTAYAPDLRCTVLLGLSLDRFTPAARSVDLFRTERWLRKRLGCIANRRGVLGELSESLRFVVHELDDNRLPPRAGQHGRGSLNNGDTTATKRNCRRCSSGLEAGT